VTVEQETGGVHGMDQLMGKNEPQQAVLEHAVAVRYKERLLQRSVWHDNGILVH